jgi:acyl CoA:acetate/3-ketoacid CoA transferase alpha subunit
VTAGLRSKVVSLAEAGQWVADGCRLAVGGFAVYQHPMALVRELARQGRRDLTVVGSVNGDDVDLLAGAGPPRVARPAAGAHHRPAGGRRAVTRSAPRRRTKSPRC